MDTADMQFTSVGMFVHKCHPLFIMTLLDLRRKQPGMYVMSGLTGLLEFGGHGWFVESVWNWY